MLCGYSPPLFPAGALLVSGSTSVSAGARTSGCLWLSPCRQTRSAGRSTASRKFGRSTTSIVLPEAYLRPSARRSARVVFCAFQLFIPDLSYSSGFLPRSCRDRIAMVQPPTADPCKGYADPTMDLPHFDALLRHDAILSNTPSRRIRPWKRAL